MKRFEVEIWIGKKFTNLNGDKYVATLEIKNPYIPSGSNIPDGANLNHFINLNLLGTYIADWFDVLARFEISKDNFVANIHLNNQSCNKTFSGQKIIELIDLLDDMDYENLKNFPIN